MTEKRKPKTFSDLKPDTKKLARKAFHHKELKIIFFLAFKFERDWLRVA